MCGPGSGRWSLGHPRRRIGRRKPRPTLGSFGASDSDHELGSFGALDSDHELGSFGASDSDHELGSFGASDSYRELGSFGASARHTCSAGGNRSHDDHLPKRWGRRAVLWIRGEPCSELPKNGRRPSVRVKPSSNNIVRIDAGLQVGHGMLILRVRIGNHEDWDDLVKVPKPNHVLTRSTPLSAILLIIARWDGPDGTWHSLNARTSVSFVCSTDQEVPGLTGDIAQ